LDKWAMSSVVASLLSDSTSLAVLFMPPEIDDSPASS
ncbi:hypothetical protein Tco_0865526, partial [Tanacetum coccineum]